jgi:fatty acid desaturase
MLTPPSVSRTQPPKIEWPTLLLAAAIYGSWMLVTAFHAWIPGWLLPLLGGWFIAWHGSLQHETIHGHPTGRPWIDGLIGGMPLSLWLPYAVYRRTHIAHHATPAVTDPFDDPESRYLVGGSRLRDRALHRLEAMQATLAGRLLIGPAFAIIRSLAGDIVRLRAAPREVARDWLPHLIGAIPVIAWLYECGISLAEYLLFFVYPGTALSLLRSFAEHRAAPLPGHRVAVVERAGPWALLFLNNNLHAAHHRVAGLSWYRLPAYYRANRATLLADNGNLVYAGYGEIARRYLFRRHDSLVHPAYRGSAG